MTSDEQNSSEMSTKVKVRCPHCKGKSFTLYERLETANGWRVSDGDVSPMFAPDGMPDTLGFAAACDCGHRWVPRRSSALQIMDAGQDL